MVAHGCDTGDSVFMCGYAHAKPFLVTTGFAAHAVDPMHVSLAFRKRLFGNARKTRVET